MAQTFGIVLAAGNSKRMKSNTPKVAHTLLNKTLLQWTIDSLLNANVKNIMVVISKNPVIENILKEHYESENVKFCYQDKALGTAHAVQCGLQAIESWNEDDQIMIAYGDTPRVKSSTYEKLLQFQQQEQNAITIVAFYAKNPFGYGRIVLNEQNDFLEIREEKDCSPEEKEIHLCHSGLMCANFELLKNILPQIRNENEASEFYLTDVVRTAKDLGYKVGFMASDHEEEFLGVNTPEQLKYLESILCAE